MKNVGFVVNENAVIVVINGVVTEVFKDSAEYVPVLEALQQEDFDELKNLINKVRRIQEAFQVQGINSIYSITDDGIFRDGKLLEGGFMDDVLDFYNKGLPFKPLLRLYDRLQENVEYDVRNQFYRFWKHNEFPVTSEGKLIAWKGVRQDRWDIYTGKTFRYIDGAVIEMNKSQISKDPNQACAPGIHVGTMDYASNWAGSNGVVIACEIDPIDICRVPYDCESQKMAVSRLRVLNEVSHRKDEVVKERIWF